MHEIIQRDYAYSDGKLLEQWYREVNTQIRSIIEHINNTPQAVDWTPQLQQIVARLDAIESANAQTQTDLSQIRTEIVEIQNMLASLVGTPVSPPPAAEFSGTVSLTSGIATFGQVIPEGQIPSGSYVKVGSLTTQNDIKTTWDDGSIRFVVLTCEPGSEGDYALSRDNTSQASAMTPPAIPSNTYVEFDIGGSVYRATCPTTHSSDKWLDGSLCVESRFDEVVPILVSDGTTEHGFLRVIFDVRSYSASEYRIDVTVENVLDTSAAGLVTYDVDIVVNGSSVFTQATVSHLYLSRWRKTFVTGYTKSKTDIDFTLCHTAGALPKFLSSVINPTYSQADAKYGILREGDVSQDMASPGGAASLAYYPNWSAQYIVHKGTTQYDHVLRMGDLAASWPIHVRKLDTEITETGLGNLRLVSIDQESLYWIDNRAEAGNKPAGATGLTDSGWNGSLRPDNAHQPSLAYIPYLITGDRFYADEMAYWGIYDLLHIRSGRGSEGILWPGNQARGNAWALRNMVDAGCYLPTGDAVRAHLREKVINNLENYDTLVTNDTTPLGTFFTKRQVGINNSQRTFSGWENNYIAWSIDHAHKQGFATDGTSMMEAIINFNLSCWDSSDWPNDYICFSSLFVGDNSDPTNYYTTLLEVIEDTYGSPISNPVPFKGFYGVDHRVSYMIGIQQNLGNSQAAYNYISPIVITETYVNGVSDAANRSGWAIDEL